MFYSDHEPAHFHAIYGEYEALIEIETFSVFRGSLRGARSRWYWNGPRSTVLSFGRIGNALARGNA